jgi:hypothetical protein
MAAAVAPSVTLLLPHGNWPWALLGVLLLAIFGWIVRVGPPTTRTQRHFVSTVMVCLAAVQLFLTVKPFVDMRYKSFVPFVEVLREFIPADESTYVYQPDKTLFGVVRAYTGRHVERVEIESLAEMSGADETHWVMVRDRRLTGGNYAAILNSGSRIGSSPSTASATGARCASSPSAR